MGKSIRNYLIFLGVVVLIMSLTVFSPSNRKRDWQWTFDPESKQPYGLYIFGKELKHFFTKKVIQESYYTPYEYLSVKEEKEEPYNYIFTVGSIDKVSLRKLLAEVERGSQVLFLNSFYSLTDSLEIKTEDKYRAEDLQMQLNSPSFDKKVPIELKQTFLGVNYFTDLHKNRDKALGYMYFYEEGKTKRELRKKINFVEVSHGKGKLYIHAGPPIAFTNYYLKKDPKVRDYAATILSYLPKDRSTVWFATPTQDRVSSSDALLFIMSQPQLRIAWWLLLLGFLLYLLFKGKRQQRIIPVIEKPKNTTVEFAQSVSSLYYQEGNATDMVQKKITYFLDQVRQRYYMDTQQINEDFAQKLYNKSGKDKTLVENIVQTIVHFRQTQQAQEETLTQMDKWIDEFWKP